jgi:hypothetical protein
MDCEEQIANILLIDTKKNAPLLCILGDVISFHTTFGQNKENRPFDVFVDFNHLGKM